MSRLIIRSTVVLPHPDGPTRMAISPAGDFEAQVGDGDGAVGEALADRVEADHDWHLPAERGDGSSRRAFGSVSSLLGPTTPVPGSGGTGSRRTSTRSASGSNEHIVLTLLAVGIGFAIAFPLAIVSHRWRRLYGPMLAVTSGLYTLPSIALFGLMIPTRVVAHHRGGPARAVHAAAASCETWSSASNRCPPRSSTRPTAWVTRARAGSSGRAADRVARDRRGRAHRVRLDDRSRHGHRAHRPGRPRPLHHRRPAARLPHAARRGHDAVDRARGRRRPVVARPRCASRRRGHAGGSADALPPSGRRLVRRTATTGSAATASCTCCASTSRCRRRRSWSRS